MRSINEKSIIVIIISISFLLVFWGSIIFRTYSDTKYIHIETLVYPTAGNNEAMKVLRYIRDDEIIEIPAYTDEGAIKIMEYFND